jgi:hypothetical protein
MSPDRNGGALRDGATQERLHRRPGRSSRPRNTAHPLFWDSLEDRFVLSRGSAGLGVLASPPAAGSSRIVGEGGRAGNLHTNQAGGAQDGGISVGSSRGGPTASFRETAANRGRVEHSTPGHGKGPHYPQPPPTGPALPSFPGQIPGTSQPGGSPGATLGGGSSSTGGPLGTPSWMPILPVGQNSTSFGLGVAQAANSGAAPASLATLVALDSASEAGGQVLARILPNDRANSDSLSPSDAQLQMAALTETSPIGPAASGSISDAPELGAGSVRFPLNPAGAPIPGSASDADARSSTPESRSTSIASAGTSRPRGDRPDAHKATNGASRMSNWFAALMSMETTEATRQFAAISVLVGAVLAWKSHQSTRTAPRKAKDRESKAAR